MSAESTTHAGSNHPAGATAVAKSAGTGTSAAGAAGTGTLAADAAGTGTRADGMRADARRNYERLIAAAVAAFAERGADDVSLEEIARRAGVGIGTLYRHFPTRQSLLEAVYLGQVNALGARAAELMETGSPGESLAEWFTALVAFGKAKRGLSTALMQVLDKDSELLSSCRKVLVDSTDALLERAQRAGQVRAGLRGSDVIRLSQGVSMAADLGQEPGQAERMLALVLDGLLSPGG